MIDANLILLPRETITTTETGAAVDAASLVHAGAMRVMNHVSTIKGSAGNETYSLALQAAAESTFSSPTTLATLALDRDAPAGKFEIPLSGAFILQKLATAAFLRLVLTLGGTDPSVTIESYIDHAYI